MDMDVSGQWRQWEGRWGLPFIWTALHTFGGDLSLAGNLSELSLNVPFNAPPLASMPPQFHRANPNTTAVGVGYTPEGLDQNPVYYEVLQEAAFRARPIQNLTDWVVQRAHRRYGLVADALQSQLENGGETTDTPRDPNITAAWVELLASGYAHNEGVSDDTGVGLLPGEDKSFFDADLHTPAPKLCLEFAAWGHLIDAGPVVASAARNALPEPFVYDLVNTGRVVLALLSTPWSVNFSTAFNSPRMDAQQL